eukprot:15161498-Alexandrium_andersonii.AAC.1
MATMPRANDSGDDDGDRGGDAAGVLITASRHIGVSTHGCSHACTHARICACTRFSTIMNVVVITTIT